MGDLGADLGVERDVMVVAWLMGGAKGGSKRSFQRSAGVRIVYNLIERVK